MTAVVAVFPILVEPAPSWIPQWHQLLMSSTHSSEAWVSVPRGPSSKWVFIILTSSLTSPSIGIITAFWNCYFHDILEFFLIFQWLNVLKAKGRKTFPAKKNEEPNSLKVILHRINLANWDSALSTKILNFCRKVFLWPLLISSFQAQIQLCDFESTALGNIMVRGWSHIKFWLDFPRRSA